MKPVTFTHYSTCTHPVGHCDRFLSTHACRLCMDLNIYIVLSKKLLRCSSILIYGKNECLSKVECLRAEKVSIISSLLHKRITETTHSHPRLTYSKFRVPNLCCTETYNPKTKHYLQYFTRSDVIHSEAKLI